ncbi:hypothetical protein [Actinoallomurus sp. CA-150999]|uniref:hypothetical protein n=1 Tax=Actinoallomurus sp. CA-150999 TaxID=3239887 RepID=UPI003D93ED2B
MSTEPSRTATMVLAALAGSAENALFAAQVRAAAGLDNTRFETTLADLEKQGRIVVTHHSAPDRHLAGDWRTVGLVHTGASPARAAEAARRYFDRWLRQFLQHHRCT